MWRWDAPRIAPRASTRRTTKVRFHPDTGGTTAGAPLIVPCFQNRRGGKDQPKLVFLAFERVTFASPAVMQHNAGPYNNNNNNTNTNINDNNNINLDDNKKK